MPFDLESITHSMLAPDTSNQTHIVLCSIQPWPRLVERCVHVVISNVLCCRLINADYVSIATYCEKLCTNTLEWDGFWMLFTVVHFRVATLMKFL